MEPDPFQFPDRIARLNSVAAVGAALVEHTAPLGFSGYVIGAKPHPETPYPGGFVVENWPQVWHHAYFDRHFGERDPVLHGVWVSGEPFSIDDLRLGRLGFSPSPGEIEVLDYAASLGFPHGFAVPIHRTQGYRGLACAVGGGPDPDPRARAVLRFVLEHAHDRLRALAALHPQGATAALTPREVQILTLARQGLNDAAIAEAARISVRTVRFHFENARRKLAARSRTEAVAIAVGQHLLPA